MVLNIFYFSVSTVLLLIDIVTFITNALGGVIVGATADLMLQPYGAFIAGSAAGLVATFGYQVRGI